MLFSIVSEKRCTSWETKAIFLLNEEIELVDSIIYEYNKYFQEHYQEFCRRNEIDIDKLNQENIVLNERI